MLPDLLINTKARSKGFTLIELLIVITIIGILSGVLLMVLNPNKYLGDSRNARRRTEVHTISTALYQYFLAKGHLPPDVTDTPKQICRQGGNCAGLIDLSELLTQTEYMTSIPVDTKSTDPDATGYEIFSPSPGRFTVRASLAENGETIEEVR